MATDRSHRRWPQVLAAVGTGVILAILCIGFGLDRMGLVRADGGSPVPAVFQHKVTLQRAAQASASGKDAESGRLAAAYARSAPMDSNALAMVGAAWLAQGRAADADRAFRAAGALGWRDRVTQSYWLLAAMRLGDPGVAAQRLDALLRTGIPVADLDREIRGIESIPQGRTAIAARLDNRPEWIDSYAEAAGQLVGPDFANRAAVLSLAARHGSQATCAAIGRAVGNQVNQRRYAEGLTLWRSQCVPRGETDAYVRDGGFQRLAMTGAVPVFEWIVAGKPGVAVRSQSGIADDDRRLAGSNENSRAEWLASQVLMLPQGRFRLSWRGGAAGGGELPGAVLTCQAGIGGSLVGAVSGTGERREAVVSIPANCPVQTLALTVPAHAADVWVDDVMLTAAR